MFKNAIKSFEIAFSCKIAARCRKYKRGVSKKTARKRTVQKKLFSVVITVRIGMVVNDNGIVFLEGVSFFEVCFPLNRNASHFADVTLLAEKPASPPDRPLQK